MSLYDDIIGAYDIIGARGAFDGAYGYPALPVAFGLTNDMPLDGSGGGSAMMDPNAAAAAAAAAAQGGACGPTPWGYPYGPPGPLGFPCGPFGGLSNPNVNAVAALVAAKHSLGIQARCPTKARIELLGFPRTPIPPGATLTITTQPQVLAKIYRIVIPSDIAFQLLVHEFRVGKWNLFANGDPVPAAMLDELASDIGELNPDTAPVNSQVSITVENTSNAEVDFRAGMFVKAIE
jgi:hypothetical protein